MRLAKHCDQSASQDRSELFHRSPAVSISYSQTRRFQGWRVRVHGLSDEYLKWQIGQRPGRTIDENPAHLPHSSTFVKIEPKPKSESV